jgi:NADH:ubiquinone oxidoreductase subunit E
MSKYDDKDKVRILVCTGTHCKEHKAKKLKNRLNEMIEERGLEDRIEAESSNCLGKCKHGPVIRIKPFEELLTEVKPRHAAELLDSVLQKTGILPTNRTSSE